MSDGDADRGKSDGREEVSGELVVAGGNAAQMLELVEEALDEVALSIAFEIDGSNHPHVALAWDVRGGSARGEEVDDRSGAVTAIGDGFARWAQAGDEVWQGGFVGGLPRRQQQPNRQAHRIDDDMDFGTQSSTRTANGAILAPFFPPAAC